MTRFGWLVLFLASGCRPESDAGVDSQVSDDPIYELSMDPRFRAAYAEYEAQVTADGLADYVCPLNVDGTSAPRSISRSYAFSCSYWLSSADGSHATTCAVDFAFADQSCGVGRSNLLGQRSDHFRPGGIDQPAQLFQVLMEIGDIGRTLAWRGDQDRALHRGLDGNEVPNSSLAYWLVPAGRA